MKKALLLGSLFFSTLLVAENNLGYQISDGTTNSYQPNAPQSKSYSKTVDYSTTTTTTVVNTHQTFQEDDHRYDKSYQNFDYDTYGYYNDDGYYYGYFDLTGYFFNNIFFTYTNLYTYNDRRYRRGYFLPHHRHHRAYRHHTVNNWNRVHCYREPNHIVYGHYYDQRYYPTHRRPASYHSNYSHRDTARMTLPNRNSNHNYNNRNSNTRNYNNHQSTHRNNTTRNNTRDYSNSHRNYNNNIRNDNRRNDNHRDTARMTTHRNSSTQQRSSSNRSSSPKQQRSSTGHMQMSR
ncbi:hypothetical protein KKC56_04050 [Patescibacteria group bacterium]|nr:hypothetical protein [Patescibacteria group bacterium]MBU1957124.1 hypothetical protein [bacterium]